MADPVTMTFPGIPGSSAVVERQAYRDMWYPIGWRSSDDPSFIPSSAIVTSRFVRVPTNWGDRWRKAKAEAGSRIIRVHAWGDSITVGDDASGGQTANTHAQKALWLSDSYLGLFIARAQTKFGNAGSGFHPVGLAVTTGTWTAGYGYGGCDSRASAAASMEWQNVRGTTVLIFHKNTSITGSFRYQIDGGGFTTVTPPTGFGVDPGVVTVGSLSDTTHTVRVEWVSGNVGISGVEGQRGTTGLRVSRCAQHGQAGSDYSYQEYKRVVATITNGAATFTIAGTGGFTQYDLGKYVVDTSGGPQLPGDVTISAISSATSATLSANATGTGTRDFMFGNQPPSRTGIANLTIAPAFSVGQGDPDLVIIALGVNDPTNFSRDERTFRDGIGSIINPYRERGATVDYVPDFLFVVHHMGTWFDVYRRWPNIAKSIYDMADGVKGAVVDYWEMGHRSWLYAKTGMGSSYWSGALGDNQIHPSVSGHVLGSTALIDLLT